MGTYEQDVEDTVDEIVDDMDVNRLESEAGRLQLSVEELLEMCKNEVAARLTGRMQ